MDKNIKSMIDTSFEHFVYMASVVPFCSVCMLLSSSLIAYT
jgi:hypothetical protein